MARFITVLNNRTDLQYWSAIQEADTLVALQAIPTYRAGNNTAYDKIEGDREVGEKVVVEETTNARANARMIERNVGTPHPLSIASIKGKFIQLLKKMGLVALMLAVLLPLVSCSTNGHLTRRYKKITLSPTDKINEYVKVEAYVIEKDKESGTPKKSLFDLSEKAQKELIKQIAIKETKSSDLIDNLTKPLSASSTPAIELIDFTKFERRVVITLKNISSYPADRISKADIKLKLDDKLRLLSCNRLATEFQTLDLGKLNFSNTFSGELSANLGAGFTSVAGSGGNNTVEDTNTSFLDGNNTTNKGNTITKTANGSTLSHTDTGMKTQGLNGKLSGSRSFAEEVLLKQRIVSLNASISDNTLSLFQESVSGIDLTGNIIADIVFDGNSSTQDVAVDKIFSFADLLDINKQFNAPDKIKVKEAFITYFNFTNDITAIIDFEAKFRHVTKGDKTISEADDEIKLFHGSYTPKDPQDPKKSLAITILRKDQLMPRFFILKLKDPGLSKIPVMIKSPSGTTGELLFNSYTDGRDFLFWLLQKYAGKVDASGKITMTLSNGYSLIFPDRLTSIDDIEIRALRK